MNNTTNQGTRIPRANTYALAGSATGPITTVGTVSLPRATLRTNSAPDGSSQMFTVSYGTCNCSSWRSKLLQKPHPGRQYTVMPAGSEDARGSLTNEVCRASR